MSTRPSYWIDGGWFYKRQPDFLTENEFWCLEVMPAYVPADVERLEGDLIRMRYVPTVTVTDADEFLFHYQLILDTLRAVGIRHGDLTAFNVIPTARNYPVLIDFAESRLDCDPRADKRPEGDAYWLDRTLRYYANKGNAPHS